MGLDWIPMMKPKAGFEKRVKQIFRILTDQEKPGTTEKNAYELKAEWIDNSITSYETIGAPQVGKDKIADDWVLREYEESNTAVTEEEFLKEMQGYYVIELAKEKEGLPDYISYTMDRNVFRGQFLSDCIELIGTELFEEAFITKFAEEALAYGQQLMTIADKLASENNLPHLKFQPVGMDVNNEESLEFKLDVLYAAASWLVFYGKNGHGFEAYF